MLLKPKLGRFHADFRGQKNFSDVLKIPALKNYLELLHVPYIDIYIKESQFLSVQQLKLQIQNIAIFQTLVNYQSGTNGVL